MNIDSTGVVTKPLQPAFKAHGAGSFTSVTAGSNGTMVLATVDYNIGSHYNNSTYKFTAPVAGRYFFSLSAYLQQTNVIGDSTDNYFYVRFFKNDGGLNELTINGYGNNGDQQQSQYHGAILNLSANDTVKAVLGAVGQNADYYGGHTYFAGYFLG